MSYGFTIPMARVRSIPSSELPSDLADVYERFAGGYGPFRNQVAVFAHVPAALRHLLPMLMELREARTLPKRYLEITIVVVSKLNECHYCVAHHKPFLAVEGLSPRAIDDILDPANPELDEVDRLVVEYATAAWETPNRNWLISTTATMVASCSKGTRDLLRSFGCGMGPPSAGSRGDGAPSSPPPHSF